MYLVVHSKFFWKLFLKFTEWVKENPYGAISGIILLYVVSISLLLPIKHIHITLGLTYAQILDSTTDGFLAAAPIVFVGTYLGSFSSFFIARYCLRDYIKDKIDKHS